mmetsp:Transcript_114327/g.220071  ORF Transcript_114327/g.220071 Transcript_114327/m.220071 type:complete len:545 (-) Transcript_114327:85-1719(-)
MSHYCIARLSRALFLTVSNTIWCSAAAVQVETSFGDLIGHVATVSDGHRCEEFLGIPFAEKTPRFTSPVPWQTSYPPRGLVASKYATWCPQVDGMSVSGDEDCLFLNVWRPHETSAGDNLAVMVWIYGGGFNAGDAGDTVSPNTYNGCGLSARHNVIVAGMNYRIGVLGFTALPNPSGGVAANWGLEDQREALRWLQREASRFGGDSKKITIFGESAGAQSVWYHLASRRSAGLFHAAISESGFPSGTSSKYRLNQTFAFAELVGCRRNDSAGLRACFTSKSAEELVRAAASIGGDPEELWGPTIDGTDLVDYPDVLFRQNRTLAVPILTGINTNEGTSFLYPAYPEGMNASQYRHFLTDALVGGDRGLTAQEIAKVLLKYPANSSQDMRPVASALFTDLFLCRDLNALDHLSTQVRTFVYRFDHRPTCPRPSFAPGAYHGMEMPYVFGTPKTYDCSFTDEEEALSERMQLMWTNFAKHLNPSIPGEPFPEYLNPSRRGLVLRAPTDSTDNGYRASFCKVWDEIWESWGEIRELKKQHAAPIVV